jgi:gluconolactonase
VSVFRKPSDFGNGNTRDQRGRLVTCEHGGRRVTRTEHDGQISVLMDHWQGKPLNSPNDVVVKSDGSIWFTDPPFGILGHHEGRKAAPENGQNVYRIDGETAEVALVIGDVLGPNGLCFSLDENILYIFESRGAPNRKILAYDLSADGRSICNKRVHIDAGAGTPDGMRCDVDGVFVFAPDGVLIGRIALPERCANVCFDGLKRNRLFMASSQSMYSLYVNTQGVVSG